MRPELPRASRERQPASLPAATEGRQQVARYDQDPDFNAGAFGGIADGSEHGYAAPGTQTNWGQAPPVPEPYASQPTGMPGTGVIVATGELGGRATASTITPALAQNYSPGGREPFTGTELMPADRPADFPGAANPSKHVISPVHPNSLGAGQ